MATPMRWPLNRSKPRLLCQCLLRNDHFTIRLGVLS